MYILLLLHNFGRIAFFIAAADGITDGEKRDRKRYVSELYTINKEIKNKTCLKFAQKCPILTLHF